MDTPKNFQCNLCLKNYSSKSSLCNHNKRFHNDNDKDKEKVNLGKPKVNIKVNIKSSFSQPEITKYERCKTFLCKFCNKDFIYKQSKWRHVIYFWVLINDFENLDWFSSRNRMIFLHFYFFTQRPSLFLRVPFGQRLFFFVLEDVELVCCFCSFCSFCCSCSFCCFCKYS